MNYCTCLSAFIQPLPPTGTAFFSLFSTLLYSGQSGSRASSTSRLEMRPGPGRILSGRPSGPQPLLTVIAGRGRQGPFPKRFLSRSGGMLSKSFMTATPGAGLPIGIALCSALVSASFQIGNYFTFSLVCSSFSPVLMRDLSGGGGCPDCNLPLIGFQSTPDWPSNKASLPAD